MSQGTKKAHRTGRFGPRYGTSVRRRVRNIERLQFKSHRCPRCLTGELKRVSTSVWRCRKCEHKFAGGAYVPRTESFGKAQAPEEEIEAVSEQFEAELEEEEPEEPVEEPEADEEPAEPEPEEPDVAEDEEAEADVEADEDEAPSEDEEERRDIGELFED